MTITAKAALVAFVSLGVCSLLGTAPAYAEEPTPTESTAPAPTYITVNRGDTLSSIARAHELTYVQLFNANETITNPDQIDVGDKIRIPTKEEALPDRFSTYQAPAAPTPAPVVQQPVTPQAPTTPRSPTPTQAAAPVARTSSAGNTYGWGQCTWYAKNRRPDLPNRLGNGGQWVSRAASQGIATGSTPRAGAIAEIPGHVMYVESVNSNGTINISEMNYNGGVGVVNHRTIAASSARYIY